MTVPADSSASTDRLVLPGYLNTPFPGPSGPSMEVDVSTFFEEIGDHDAAALVSRRWRMPLRDLRVASWLGRVRAGLVEGARDKDVVSTGVFLDHVQARGVLVDQVSLCMVPDVCGRWLLVNRYALAVAVVAGSRRAALDADQAGYLVGVDAEHGDMRETIHRCARDAIALRAALIQANTMPVGWWALGLVIRVAALAFDQRCESRVPAARAALVVAAGLGPGEVARGVDGDDGALRALVALRGKSAVGQMT